MPIREFEYLAPQTIFEAAEFLSSHRDSRVLAGGQSLIPLLKLNLVELKFLLDLKRIPSISSIEMKRDNQGKDVISIGSLATHSFLERSKLVREFSPLLSKTARGIGHPLVRNRGTIGGSLCHCDPSADYYATLLALGSNLKVESTEGEREVAVENFFIGPFQSALKKGEILKGLDIPVARGNIGYSIKKLSLGHGSFPLVVVSVVLGFEKGVCNLARIALAGVAERPFRAGRAEENLLGEDTRALLRADGNIEKAALAAGGLCEPSSDAEISSEYKKKMAVVLTRRALFEALEGCK